MDKAPMLSITVCDPLTLPEGGKEYVVYTIDSISQDPCFPTPFYRIRRRFSEFEELRQLLASRHEVTIPDLPSKYVMSCCKLKTTTARRMKGIQKFIDGLIAVPELKADQCLFYFLQTKTRMSDIQRVLNDNIPKQDSPSCSESEFQRDTSSPPDQSSSCQVQESTSSENLLPSAYSKEPIFPIDDFE